MLPAVPRSLVRALLRAPLLFAFAASASLVHPLVEPLAAPLVRAEDEATVARLVVADPSANKVMVLDGDTIAPLAAFETPGAVTNLVASPGGRWVYALQT